MTSQTVASGKKLHVGCGDSRLEGWVNVDLAPYPAVDVVQDVTKALPFSDCSYIFAEHFIEHLSLDDAGRFLALCRSALSASGVVRLTTPNLDWVWSTQYHPTTWGDSQEAVGDCLRLNRSFYGWGHRFLYNWQALDLILRAAGFAQVVPCQRNHSTHSALRDLERHETYPDEPTLPHVLVAEAYGVSDIADRPRLDSLGDYRRDTVMPFHQLQYAALSAIRLIKRAVRRGPVA